MVSDNRGTCANPAWECTNTAKNRAERNLKGLLVILEQTGRVKSIRDTGGKKIIKFN